MSTVHDFQASIFNMKKFPELKPGYTVRVHLKVTEGKKERVQIFEGLIIKKKGNRPETATITVRKIASGVGVERIFPLISPSIVKIDVVKKAKVRRANLGYLRDLTGKAARLKESFVSQAEGVVEEESVEEVAPAETPKTEETPAAEEKKEEATAEEKTE